MRVMPCGREAGRLSYLYCTKKRGGCVKRIFQPTCNRTRNRRTDGSNITKPPRHQSHPRPFISPTNRGKSCEHFSSMGSDPIAAPGSGSRPKAANSYRKTTRLTTTKNASRTPKRLAYRRECDRGRPLSVQVLRVRRKSTTALTRLSIDSLIWGQFYQASVKEVSTGS